MVGRVHIVTIGRDCQNLFWSPAGNQVTALHALDPMPDARLRTKEESAREPDLKV